MNKSAASPRAGYTRACTKPTGTTTNYSRRVRFQARLSWFCCRSPFSWYGYTLYDLGVMPVMRTALEDGTLQLAAPVSLLENSRLVKWVPDVAKFAPVTRAAFESSWGEIDPVFGRLICWIIFSAGAEFLAKGVCLVRGVEIRKEQEVPLYPTAAIHAWVPKFRKDWKSAGTMTTTHFGTIGSLTNDDSKSGVTAALTQLCSTVGATVEQKELLFAAHELLRRTIRNRDAHAYVPNVRDSHFSLVAEIFSNSFNILVEWLPGGSATLNRWRAEASSFIAALDQ